jgi:hypothetical protein
MWLYLAISALMGILAAVLLHWFTWWLRLYHSQWTVVLGVTGALIVTSLGMLYLWPYASDIAQVVQTALILFWSFAVAVGSLQARSIPAPWWVGALGLFFEAALGFIILSTVNLSLQRLAFGSNFYNLERFIYIPPSSVYLMINYFMQMFLLTFLVLALLRPAIRLRRLNPSRRVSVF